MLTRRDLLAVGVGSCVSALGWQLWYGNERLHILDQPRVFQANPFPDLDKSIDAAVLEAVHASLGWRTEMGVPDLLHWVRIYGCKNNAQFQPQKAEEVISLLTDDKKIESRFGQSGVIVKTDMGIRYLSRLSNLNLKQQSRPAHPGQAVAILGEIGTPANAPLYCESKCFAVRDAIIDSIRSIQVRDSRLQEPEWPTQVIAHYLESPRWKNRWNENVKLEDWVEFLLQRNLATYCCGGTHLLQALAFMLKADEQSGFLTRGVVDRMRNVCGEYSTMLESTQHDDGTWRDDWTKTVEIKGSGPMDVHMTGHILEGQLYLPTDLRISTKSASVALRSLARKFLTSDSQTIWNNFCPYSHAGRVLLMCSTTNQNASGGVVPR